MAPRKKSLKKTRKKSRAGVRPGRAAGVATGKSKQRPSSRLVDKPVSSGTKKKAAVRRPKRFTLGLAPGLERLIGGSRRHSKACRDLADRVIFTVVPKAMSADSSRAPQDLPANLDRYRPTPEAKDAIVSDLEKLGFEIIHRGEFGIGAAGPAWLVADVLKIELGIQARPRRTRLRATQNFAVSCEVPSPNDLYVAPTESLSVKSTINDYIDRFLFMPPPHSFAPSAAEPAHGYFGIDKAAIRRLLNIPAGATGAGVNVGMVDTGFFPHPYYEANSLAYRPTPTPSVPNPLLDPEGHGTAMAYNTLAVAPGATLMGFKKINEAPQIALEDAARGADIITCSWGWRDEQRFDVVEHTINSIVDQGKIVLFSSGDGDKSWPASMPQVLAIGGAYVDQNGQLEASNYASGFASNYPDYNHRQVPDVCGLCGQRPMGIYIMLPCPPNCQFDQIYAGQSFPNRDETQANDGWFCASGTSSATAQIAGVVALMIERARALGRPPLTTDRVKTILQQTATAVQRGKNAQGVAAVGHPNGAVGFGLVNAAAAIAAV